MDNRIISVAPAQDSPHALASVPACERNFLGLKPYDDNGRERRFVFSRRMNSAALALFSDSLLTIILIVVLVALLMIGLGIFAMSDLGNIINNVVSGEDVTGMVNRATCLAMVAVCIGSFFGHVIPAYMHSSRCGFNLTSTLRRGSRLGSALPAAIVVALGFTYSWVFIYSICGRIWPDSFFAGRSLTASAFKDFDTATMIISGLTTGVFIPIAEEILFRGALLKSFSRYGTGFAVVASSLLFGLMHGNMFQTPFATIGGLVMAYVAVRSGSILPSILIHMSINSYSVISDILKVVVPEQHLEKLQYILTGVSGLFILGAVIILCTCARRISWTPIDRENSNTLLPQVDSKVRLKGLRFVLSFGILLFIAIYLFVLMVDCGLDFGLTEAFETSLGDFMPE